MLRGWLDEESYRLAWEDWVHLGEQLDVANR